FAILELGLQHLNRSALSDDVEALGGEAGNFADLAADIGKTPEYKLAGVEDLKPSTVQGGPCARSGIAAANQIIDVVEGLGPVDLRLGGAAPSFIAGSGLVLLRLGMLAGQDEVGGLDHRLDAHGKEAIEIYTTERVIGADGRSLLQ